MPRAPLLAFAIGLMTMLFAIDAGAAPLGPVNAQSAVESNLTLVRDGCGRGMRFSERRNACVEDNREFRSGRGDGFRDDGFRRDNFRDGGRTGFRDDGFRDGRRARLSSKALCEQSCQDRRAICNERKGGFVNGCGVAAAACIATCD